MNIMSTRMPNKLLTVMGLTVVLAAGALAVAQQRVGNDGRALDANQQVGSAGYNSVEGRLDYSRQNNIITGNVGGGRGFQDTIDYRAVGEFQDTLGSDTLFDFRARSLSSSPGYLNAARVGGVGPSGNVSVYRSFTNRVAQPRGPGLIAPEGGAFQLVPEASRFTLRGDAFGRLRQGGAVGNLTPGLALQAFSSSPTLGLRGQLMPTQALNRKLYEAGVESGALEMPVYMIAPPRYDSGVFDPFGKPRDTTLKMDLRPGQVPPTLMIGQQLQTLIDPTKSTLKADDRFRNDQMLASVFRPLDGRKDDGGDIYLNLLRAIRQSKDESGDTADLGGWDAKLEAPTSQQVTEAERAYARIMKEMYGEDYESRRDRSGTTPDTDAEDGESGEAVRGVIDRLNYDLPRLETLASNKRTRIAKLTREAEAALASGKYLSAESRYRQIILDVRDDPLPRIGLIHAQLGAGMFRSAGMNLRAVFSQHPELIAARYDAKLLPPVSRLQWIQQELQDAISKGEGGKDAPVLMAYLGYQANSRQIVRYGLALAQSKSPRDPLLVVLREIWLDESDASSGDGK